MRDGLIILRLPPPLILGPPDLLLMAPLEHAITRDVESRRGHIIPDAPEDVSIVDPGRLQQGRQVIDAEMPVGTTVALARTRLMLGEDLLAGEGRVAASAPVGVAADVAVGVPDVVPILLVEGVVGDQLEAGPPEQKAFFQVQPERFQEQRVL